MSVTKSPNEPNANWRDILHTKGCRDLKCESNQGGVWIIRRGAGKKEDIPLAAVAMLDVYVVVRRGSVWKRIKPHQSRQCRMMTDTSR